MEYQEQAVLRSQTNVANQKVGITQTITNCILLTLVLLAGFSSAQAGNAPASRAYIVGNDRGGFIRDRLIELRDLRASGRNVEIRGKICYSTCTMLLGLPKTCISPDTTFGFHGPTKSGKRLAPDRFEYFSRVISQYYPAPLQSWYMSTGRTRLRGMYRIKGAEIVRMGIRAC